MLAEFGVLLVAAGVDAERGTIAAPVRVTARGWFDGETDRKLLADLTEEVRQALTEALKGGDRDEGSLNRVAQRTAGRLLGQKFRRQPVVLAAVAVL